MKSIIQTNLKLLKFIGTTCFLTFIIVITYATTWGPLYPYTQKTENGKVKSYSIPYGVHDGGYGPGETFVYYTGKLLYSINKYFTSTFLTTNNGQYLVEIDFHLDYRPAVRLMDNSGKVNIEPVVYEGEAVNIYKDGKLLKTILFSELKIDTSKIKVGEFGQWFAWNYNLEDTTKNELKKKMFQHPAFIENDNLYLISADNQLLTVEISTGQITDRQNAYETLNNKSNWMPATIKRYGRKVKYPYQFLLPELQNGNTIEQGLAEHLNKKISMGESDSAHINIYFHTLLINKEGKCEVVYTSPRTRKEIKTNSYNDDSNLKFEIEKWIMQQTFETKTFPKHFPKFKYTGFVYLN